MGGSNTRSDKERLFFALWPGDRVREAVEARLPPMPRRGRAVPRSNWHVTLAFLGETAPERRRAYESAAETVAARPFELVLDRLGYFHRPRVLWLGAEIVPEELAALHADLTAVLAEQGFEPDRRPFTAHLTLARKMPPPGDLPAVSPLSWPVAEFCLVRSDLDRRGARYTVVRRFPLTGE
jgi:2'-5' RNA ligase